MFRIYQIEILVRAWNYMKLNKRDIYIYIYIYILRVFPVRCLSPWKIKSPTGNPSSLTISIVHTRFRYLFGILSSVYIEYELVVYMLVPFIDGTKYPECLINETKCL